MMTEDINSVWRLSASSIYGRPKDGKIFGAMEIDVTGALAFIHAQRAEGLKLTLTHLTLSVLAKVFGHDVPELNLYIARGRFFRRPTVLAGVTILQDTSGELGLTLIDRADTKDLKTIVAEVRAGVKSTRTGHHAAAVDNKRLVAAIPWPFRRVFMKLMRFLILECGISIKSMGVSPTSFGSFIVSNVGTVGVDIGWGALLPPSNLPALFTMGKPQERVVVRNGAMEIRTIMMLGATFDHRVIDGYHAGQLVSAVRRRFEHQDW